VKLLIATSNPGKVSEFRGMLGDLSFKWRDLSAYPKVESVEETGQTFRANACLKAGYYARHTRCWALADDSGLEVDALHRKPGIFSARWARMHDRGSGDAANNELLLSQLAAVPEPERGARFVCVLALSDSAGRIVLTAHGSVPGQIARQSRGANGFGYDPLFFVNQLQRTMAELNSSEKQQVSHRGVALGRMKSLMIRARLL
jgi:XTP/dITP diphosphohydrolase